MKTRKILVCLGLLVAAVILISIVHHYQLRAATNAYIAQLKAQGEPMDLAQVLPPRLAPEENSAGTFREAAALMKTDKTLLSTNYYFAMKMVAPGKAQISSRLPEARDVGITNSWEEVAAAITENKELFSLLQSCIEKPKFDFGINYESGIGDISYTNFCLTESRVAALRLRVAVLYDLHHGDPASAVKNTRAMLAIVKGMSEERLLISELVRTAIAPVAMSAIWEILQSTNATEEQLATLQSDWASVEFLRSEENALELERASGAITLKKMRSSNSKVMHELLPEQSAAWATWSEPTAMDRLRLRFRAARWRYWSSYPDELRLLEGYQALLAAPRAARTNYALLQVKEELLQNIEKLSIPATDGLLGLSDPMKKDIHFLLSSSLITDSHVFNQIMKIEAAKQLTVAAIALKRYKIKHREYPPSLTALVPDFLPEIPRDPIDGQSLRYRLNADGTFLLYSIGDDGEDNGGDATPSEEHKDSLAWQFARDWVWPQPATAEEVQKFYEKPPK